MFPILVRATVEGAIVVALIWIVSRTLRRLSPATHAILWWCAAVRFLVALIWTVPVALPVLPATDLLTQQVIAPAERLTLAPPATAGEHLNESGVPRTQRNGASCRALGDWMSGRHRRCMSPFMSNARGHSAIVAGSNGSREDGPRARLPFGIEDGSCSPPVR